MYHRKQPNKQTNNDKMKCQNVFNIFFCSKWILWFERKKQNEDNMKWNDC